MMFCPKCGSLLKPKTEDNKRILVCSCGFKDKGSGPIAIKESLATKKEDKKSDAIVDSDQETLPITDAECEKCKHTKAYYWLVQTRAADEPATKFLKCVKCKHTWRDYS